MSGVAVEELQGVKHDPIGDLGADRFTDRPHSRSDDAPMNMNLPVCILRALVGDRQISPSTRVDGADSIRADLRLIERGRREIISESFIHARR